MSATTEPTISAKELHDLLRSTDEFALLDVRQPRRTAEQGSILLGVSLPLSVLELRIDALVPRRSTNVVVYSAAADGLAERARDRLRELGYTDVTVLDGGIEAWADAGFKVQSGGDNVVGQAFGEWIEVVYDTPHITVPEYLDKVAAGEDIVLLDSRPLPEFESHSLPGGTAIPGAELVYRAREAVTSDESLVVVHCAGRTRSILGAQVLINAGLPNRVVALEGGTQSWVLEGHEVEHGHRVEPPLPSGDSLTDARAAAARIAGRFGVVAIDKATLATFRAEADERSLYLLDVRTPDEFAAGHLPGSVSAPSWDVAPWVFRHAATHNARVVLIDNDQVRATVAASWIIQIGWGEVFVLGDAFDGEELESGPVQRRPIGVPDTGYDLVTAAQAAPLVADGAVAVVDLQPSPAHRAGHVPGAQFALRLRLPASVGDIAGDGPILLVSEDGVLARLAAVELAAVTTRAISVLDGGFAAWLDAGHPVEHGEGQALHAADDVVPSGWRETDLELRKAGFRRYLAWELGLVAELAADDTVPFRSFSEEAAP